VSNKATASVYGYPWRGKKSVLQLEEFKISDSFKAVTFK
jgi:hypothetical protein